MLKRVLHAANQVVTHEETHTGKELIIESTVNAPAEVRVRGDSWQGSTTGAQLFDYTLFPESLSAKGIKIVNNGDGAFTASGQKTEIGGVNLVGGEFVLPAGTYTLSGILPTNLYVVLSFTKDENIYYWQSNSTKTFDEETIVKAYVQVADGFISETTIYPMLNAGSTPLPWEPYTGNAPSPSPEYPQDIISVSGTLKSTNNSLGGRDKLRESQITIPELRAIPGTDVRDELVVYEDGSGKIVRNTVLRTFYGTESLSSNGGVVNGYFRCKMSFPEIKNEPEIKGICNKLRRGSGDMERFNLGYRSFYLWIDINRLNGEESTLDDVKEFIASHPLAVLAERATPTEEPLTAAEVQGFLRTHQYHTEIGLEGLDEHLEPEVEVRCRVLGR